MIVPEIVFLTNQLYERVNASLLPPDAARAPQPESVEAAQPRSRRFRALKHVMSRRIQRALRARSHPRRLGSAPR